MNSRTTTKIAVLVVLLLCIFVTEAYGEDYCYKPYGTDVQVEFSAEYSLIKINWIKGGRGDVDSLASYYYDEETNATICVITARLPDQVLGDPDMDSLGHELLHCLTGDFHPGDH